MSVYNCAGHVTPFTRRTVSRLLRDALLSRFQTLVTKYGDLRQDQLVNLLSMRGDMGRSDARTVSTSRTCAVRSE